MSATSTLDQDKGRHYHFIRNTVHDTFKTASLDRGKALSVAPLKIQPWYNTASAVHHAQLKAANLKAWGSQNQVDKLFEKLQDVHAFAAPLLQAKLKQKYGVTADVKTTFLRLYLPKDLPWYTIAVTGGVTTRTVSLLDAALHNFAENETVDDDSQYISQPDKRGQFDVLPLKNQMTIRQFQTLCRELDIGGLYKQHLESWLLPGEPVAVAVIKHKVTQSLKDALGVAAQLALTTGDIQYDAYKLMRALANDEPLPLLNGRQMLCRDLSIMETRLTGILLLIPARQDSRGIRRLIAYVPHDPDHPLKEYGSTNAFTSELTRQLRENKTGAASQLSYRQFFSQFVDQQQRGHFFADLDQRLSHVVWHDKDDPTDSRPAWRKEDVPNAHLMFEPVALPRDYWTHAYQQKLNKILNDAKEIAVSTADTDTKARWAWWDNFKKIVSDIFNVALLIATPFVPGLGELMMAYTVYQLTYDVIEGIVDLAEGLALEAAEHVVSVVTDVIQLAAFAAGAEIGSALKLKLSPLIEGMKPVKLADGVNKLWHPDLSPYEQEHLTLPLGSKPNEHGLHRHINQDILPLDGKLYTVDKVSTEPASRTHRVKHPNRPGAYSPKIEHNGHGAWVHEGETPANWKGETLMRRLGHSVDRFSATELEQIRISSGADEAVLRRMHVENTPPSPLLTDTIKRFSAYADIQTASTNIRRGQPIDLSNTWFEPLVTQLPGWPPERALKVYEGADATGHSRLYGNINAMDSNTLSISVNEFMSGEMSQRLINFLHESEIEALFGRNVPVEQRAQALRNLLGNVVDRRQVEFAEHLYRAGESSDSAESGVLRQAFPDLPLPLTDTLLANASPAELQRMHDEQRLPLRLKNQARELNFEAATARAYDGFYRDAQAVPDTERLALNTLKFNTDTFGDLRIEVFEGSPEGTLRCSAGPLDATQVRKLIRKEQGQYEVLDEFNNTLHNAADFYESILRALPEEQREALGYNKGQGWWLKLWIMEHAASAAERRRVLAEFPIRPVARVETESLVRGWPWFFGAKTPEQTVKELYPLLSELEVSRFIEALPNPEQDLRRLTNERKQLRELLNGWEEAQQPFVDSDVVGSTNNLQDFLRNGGRFIQERLLQCFERRTGSADASSHPDAGYTLDLSTDFPGPPLDRWWRDLREMPDLYKHLEQVTVLTLNNARFTPDAHGLLSDFPNLRHLQIVAAGLTELPPSIAAMPKLESLNLADNNIRFPAGTTTHWNALKLLETLRLDGNPLGQALDVSALPNLKVLRLANTGITEWPSGIFNDVNGINRPRNFYLDLRDCPITDVPIVTPGSDQAFIVATARFNMTNLAELDRLRLGDYRESLGFAREQHYSPAVSAELRYWTQRADDISVFSRSATYHIDREMFWHDLYAEPGSSGFFRIFPKLRAGEDFRHGASRRQLTKRVWQMIEAAAQDTKLREELFKQARQPETCADAGAQLFNSMGMKVLVAEARATSGSATELDNALVKLARSAARLESVGEIARAEISSQQQQHLINPQRNLPPDDVEVHLAFETGLAQRLDLPWRSESMLYGDRSGVNQAKVNTAYDTIIEREKGDGLVNAMIGLFEHPFWEQHLRSTHPAEFRANDRLFGEKFGLLEDLREAQNDYANMTDAKQVNQRSKTLTRLADQLNVPHIDVFSGEEMSTSYYNSLLSRFGYERNELARTLTREAMANAGL
ncbi:hypothetical protein PS645_01910 [Pseudomonas fluorescens]|uniref:RING-type E3 ubiquitin transferase n=1 Tax=Pseudomonas fluorescens TaxID=294 RepID=A0A5E6RYR7_PSEFL|nr:NEL-type E3 ubiquitin ligase domain-containing protein [Pseudomonas fluorescens]VVM73964.1 hypothetical protein PS645_01910 [Pseudomonas fluorescens]